MRDLTRLREEANRLLGTYDLHKDSPDEHIRRKVHVDLDRWLMENREVVAVWLIKGLDAEIRQHSAAQAPVKAKARRWWGRSNSTTIGG